MNPNHLRLPDLQAMADTLSTLPTPQPVIRRNHLILLVLARLINQRRHNGALACLNQHEQANTRVLLAQIAEELGLWLTNRFEREPTWPASPTADTRRTDRYAELPEESRKTIEGLVFRLWQDECAAVAA